MFSMEGTILLIGAQVMVGSAVYRLLNFPLDVLLLSPSQKKLNLANKVQANQYFDIHRSETFLMITSPR